VLSEETVSDVRLALQPVVLDEVCQSSLRCRVTANLKSADLRIPLRKEGKACGGPQRIPLENVLMGSGLPLSLSYLTPATRRDSIAGIGDETRSRIPAPKCSGSSAGDGPNIRLAVLRMSGLAADK
jgi:hypothetical protein